MGWAGERKREWGVTWCMPCWQDWSIQTEKCCPQSPWAGCGPCPGGWDGCSRRIIRGHAVGACADSILIAFSLRTGGVGADPDTHTHTHQHPCPPQKCPRQSPRPNSPHHTPTSGSHRGQAGSRSGTDQSGGGRHNGRSRRCQPIDPRPARTCPRGGPGHPPQGLTHRSRQGQQAGTHRARLSHPEQTKKCRPQSPCSSQQLQCGRML